jgi:hypothetical protein
MLLMGSGCQLGNHPAEIPVNLLRRGHMGTLNGVFQHGCGGFVAGRFDTENKSSHQW